VNLGSVAAVNDMLDRVLPGSKAHFSFSLADTCPDSKPPCFHLADAANGTIAVTATGAAELASGLGHYFRE
jgi:hypothetical protein